MIALQARTTNKEQRTKKNEQRTTNEEQRTRNNERRTTKKNSEQRTTNKEQATVHSGSIFTCNKCRLPSGTVIIIFLLLKESIQPTGVYWVGWAELTCPPAAAAACYLSYRDGEGKEGGGGGCGSGHLAPRQSRKSGPRQTVAAQNGT